MGGPEKIKSIKTFCSNLNGKQYQQKTKKKKLCNKNNRKIIFFTIKPEIKSGSKKTKIQLTAAIN